MIKNDILNSLKIMIKNDIPIRVVHGQNNIILQSFVKKNEEIESQLEKLKNMVNKKKKDMSMQLQKDK